MPNKFRSLSRPYFIVILGYSLGINSLHAYEQPKPATPHYQDHGRLDVVYNAKGEFVPIRSASDWNVRRDHILSNFERVAGPMPRGERRVPLDVEVLDTIPEDGYTRIKLTYATEPGDRVPAWLLVPDDQPPTSKANHPSKRRPAVVCLHQTTSIGKDEPVGLGGKPNLRYALELARRGYVTLSPDYPIFGERRVDAYAMGYSSTTMKAIWDHMRAVDLLQSRSDVDPDRIGVIGHSLGGHNAIFLALFDPRIRTTVSSCGFNSFPYYYEGNLAGWSHQGYMPRIREEYKLDPKRLPFDFPELIGALAPRAFFANSPLHDENFEVEGVQVCIRAAQPIYDLFNAPNQLEVVYPEAGHDFPPEVRSRAYEFLDQSLHHTPTLHGHP